MKYIKTFERASIHHHLFPIEEEHLGLIYEYLYKLGCSPIVYKMTDELKKMNKNSDYLIYFNNRNRKANDYIINRSYSVTTSQLKKFEIDKEKEKEMEQFINQQKYNL